MNDERVVVVVEEEQVDDEAELGDDDDDDGDADGKWLSKNLLGDGNEVVEFESAGVRRRK